MAYKFAYVIFLLYLCSRKGLNTMNINDYRFTDIDREPPEEYLEQLMHEVAIEAKERYDRAHAAYFEHLRQMIQKLWEIIIESIR